MTRPRKTTLSPRFGPGDKVRVKPGVTDPEFDDIPLGGWTGTVDMVEQVKGEIIYDIEWDAKTLQAMHPVYKTRCERDGCDVEIMGLGEEDIEPDDGTPVPIEQPTAIRTPPLSMKDREDRIRVVFGLTHDDLLPDVSAETLRSYQRYLAAHLKLPFDVLLDELEEIGRFSHKRATMTVTGVLDRDLDRQLEDGLICTARSRDQEIEVPLRKIEVKKKDPNFKLIDDYSYWFDSSPGQDDENGEWDDDDLDDDEESDEDEDSDGEAAS